MNAERGSKELLEMYQRGGFVLEEDAVQRLAELVDEFELNDILVKGQPRPDFLKTTFFVEDADRCGTVVGKFLGLLGKGSGKLPGTIRVFPKGIPWPDQFQVDLTIADRAQR